MSLKSKSALFFGVVCVGLMSFAISTSAVAAKVCGEREKLTKFLSHKYKENPKAVGVSTTGKAVLEVFTSSEGSWTVMMTTTTGVTCIMGAGHSWQDSDPTDHLPKS